MIILKKPSISINVFDMLYSVLFMQHSFDY